MARLMRQGQIPPACLVRIRWQWLSTMSWFAARRSLCRASGSCSWAFPLLPTSGSDRTHDDTQPPMMVRLPSQHDSDRRCWWRRRSAGFIPLRVIDSKRSAENRADPEPAPCEPPGRRFSVDSGCKPAAQDVDRTPVQIATRVSISVMRCVQHNVGRPRNSNIPL